MPVKDLIERLGYGDSPNFLREREFAAVEGYSHVFERAKTHVRLKGVYTLKDISDEGTPNVIPIVYVCEETDRHPGVQIHRLAWNQNVVPFVLVAGRDVVRLYSGFSYGSPRPTGEDAAREGVLRTAVAFNRLVAQLPGFQAETIDNGSIWRTWEQRVDPSRRVDWRLLDNLQKLGAWLRHHGLKKDTAHALIGKYVYLRYLRDRGILSPRKFEEWRVDPAAVFGRSATLEGLRTLVERLEGWLNGSVFPLPLRGPKAPPAPHIQRVAGAFSGDDPVTGQQHLDFEPFDFSHIPIETLSVIYEQFLHAEGKGKDAGAYYTPVPLVNLMLQELEDRHPLRPGMKVLDAACGSGAFLVQCYRRLIERRLRERPQDPLVPDELKRMLVGSIFGVDRDNDACRVAELSLVLTLLDYIDPPDLHQNPDFKIPNLHKKNIIRRDFFSPGRPIHPAITRQRFDWVVGNPPWVEVKPPTDDNDRPDPDRYVRLWMDKRRKTHPTGGGQVAQAFAWRLRDFLKPNGTAALLLPAKTLFNYESAGFRKAFFLRTRTWCVANFANMTEVLFAGRSRVPAAAFYFSRSGGHEDAAEADILTYSPFVANQEANRPATPNTRKDTWNIAINAGEIRRVPVTQALRGDLLPWKVAMWGSGRDARLIERVRAAFPSLQDLGKELGLDIHEGFQLRGPGETGVEFRRDLVGRQILEMDALRGRGRIYVIPPEALRTIEGERAYLRIRGGTRGITVSHPPHVIIDDARRFAVYSDEFVAVPPRQIGIAGKPQHRRLLKALSLFLISDFATYYQFFTSPAWGIKRELATLRSLKEIPVPFRDIPDGQLGRWDDLHTDATRAQIGPPSLFDGGNDQAKTAAEIDATLNAMTYEMLGLSETERWLVEDLARVRIELDEGKLGPVAVQPPSAADLKRYADVLAAELDVFVGEGNGHHVVQVVFDGLSGVVQTRLWREGAPPRRVSVHQADGPTAGAFSETRGVLRREFSQWVYFDRKLLVLSGPDTLLFKPLQRFHWTPGQALSDADLIIGDTIMGEVS